MARAPAGHVWEEQKMSTPLEFKTLKIWQFKTEKVGDPAAQNKIPRRAAYGVLSASLDDAFELFREKHPDLRVNSVDVYDIPVHYLVTTPEAWDVAERLGA